MFGLVGKRVGTGTAPIIMVPFTGGLSAWVRPIKLHEPSEAEIETLKDAADLTILKPTVTGDETKDEDADHPLVEVTHLCFIQKHGRPIFLIIVCHTTPTSATGG